jgi:hypothetical protein
MRIRVGSHEEFGAGGDFEPGGEEGDRDPRACGGPFAEYPR